MLQAYFNKLTELGKIDTTVYTFARLTNDVNTYLLPASICLLSKMNLKGNKMGTSAVTTNLADMLDKTSITGENVLPPIMTNVLFMEKAKATDFEL